jgi:RNA polymerase sigma-70 factor (ECF subfamily)
VWVAAAQQGDTRAFRELFARHHGRIYAMCARLLADRHEVEDAVQQTFLEGWRSLYRFEGRSRFSTWLTRIAIHTCFGFRRRLRRLWLTADPDHVGAEREPLWAMAPASPDRAAVHRRQERAIAGVLQGLTPRKRVVFVLAEFEGMTAPEIARVLDIPDATVRTRLFHARRELAGALRRHPEFADLFPPSASEEVP